MVNNLDSTWQCKLILKEINHPTIYMYFASLKNPTEMNITGNDLVQLHVHVAQKNIRNY